MGGMTQQQPIWTTVDGSVAIREATAADAITVSAVVNDAFMADAFFKKPDKIYRLDWEGGLAKQMIERDPSSGNFIVAERVLSKPLISGSGSSGEPTMMGCLFVHWHLHGSNSYPEVCPGPTGSVSMVSVPDKHGKQGIGTALIAAAESLCAARLRAMGASGDTFTMEIPIVSGRVDPLTPWYSKQGYQEQERQVFPSPDIVADGHHVELVMLRKQVALAP
eukprot:TRINITY_DN4085_c0_g1_i2.p1 TRINITY_DN4085_c0_g1~~TRINITY_DN4085_c0_g1_i2.p1  ORF type:complete len:221 (-),score=28.96 TRINITY_DN4085_c0_g1_i2:53-715(-)